MLLFQRVRRWRVQRKKREDEREALRVRSGILRGAVVLAFLVLSVQLFRLQVVEGSHYQQRAEENRLRRVPMPPLRGVIYDRAGRLLVQNQPIFTASAVVADLPQQRQEEVVGKLEKLLQVPGTKLTELLQERRRSGQVFTPVALKVGLDRETAFLLEEHHGELPGVSVRMEPRRVYVAEGSLAHILGYVGRIAPEEYAELKDRGYDLNDTLGKMGVEVTYEGELRGVPGRAYVEVDAAGRTRRTLFSQESVPGSSLVLTIDLELQKEMARVLQEAMGRSRFGAAVAMNPRNGEILGMVSLPPFDNNVFSGEVQQEAVQRLLEDPRRPLMNYAIGGAYPPGSIFKLVTGTAALQEGVARPDTVIVSRGLITVPNQYDPRILYPFYDWASLGALDFRRALAMSSDVYFYYLAGGYENFRGLGPQRLASYTRLYGVGERSGIDLPGEAAGLVPDPEWKSRAYNEEWLTGDTYHFGIGQGFVLATPIQMARVVSAVANGGAVLQPRVVREVLDPGGKPVRQFGPVIQRNLPVAPEHFSVVREAMRQAVSQGTASTAQVPGVQVAGKTGTAEFGAPVSGRAYETHGWFVGFAPADRPEIAVAVFLEQGQGALTAAPAASKIFRYYFQVRR
ncbi:MAG: penicillin-binding protein 2 [Chloroflexi bacterium]|nr:penicillin-binding protein 2 [Chloroflexota bacterium]